MKVQNTLLQKQINPNLTALFKETNDYHPEIISDENGFAIVIEDWDKGIYRFVNSTMEESRISNEHFTPNNIQPLKTMYDLNRLWKVLVGKELTYIGKRIEKIELGKTYSTKRNGDLKVVELMESNKSKVEFYNGYVTIAQNVNIFRGGVKNPYHPSVFGIGYVGIGKYNSKNKDIYERWKAIIQRCYDENSRHLYKSYEGVSMCKEWECLQNFAKWYEENYKPETMQGWALDKDILSEGIKIYSPSTCAFVPPSINNVLVKAEGVNDNNPTGVIKKRNKYFVCFYKGGEIFHSSGYDTKEEASECYRFEKDKYIRELIEEYKDKLDVRIYNKLINYTTPLYIQI